MLHHSLAAACASLLSELRALGAESLAVTSSVSLQHLPWDTALEAALPAGLGTRLAFAVQKLAAIARLARGEQGAAAAGGAKWGAAAVKDSAVELPRAMFDRAEPFGARRPKQPQFPAFPTTTSECSARQAHLEQGHAGRGRWICTSQHTQANCADA